MNYHVAKNGAQLGQMSEEEITGRLATGELSAGDLCWTDGMAEWQPLGSKFRSPVFAPPPSAAASINPYAAPSSNVLVDGGKPRLGEQPGFWLRFVAHFIDQILMNIVGMVLGFVVGIASTSVQSQEMQPVATVLAMVLGMVATWLYYAFMESSSNQATFGKMALGIVVTDLNGNRISFARATGRYFGQIVSAFTLCIGFMMCAWTERKQCLHDMMAGCLVFKKS